jgi:hypothetical protein
MKLEIETRREAIQYMNKLNMKHGFAFVNLSEYNKKFVSVESMKEELNNLRTDIKCYLEDEEEIDSRIVNNVKAMFAKLYLKLE